MNNKLAFDFDDTLDQLEVQLYVIELIRRGYDIYICTHRTEYVNMNSNPDLYEMADKLGIPSDNIIITNGSHKSHFLDGFIWLLDDMLYNIEDVNLRTDCVGIYYGKGWRDRCEKLINNVNK